MKDENDMNLKLDYETWVKKFTPEKTTDDCYTPPAIYDAVKTYVDSHVCPLKGRRVLRPFFPGGDYQHEDYREGDVVVDNPPFSILGQIVDFFTMKNIPYFLFAPSNVLFQYINRPRVTAIIIRNGMIFENGANVGIGFLTNMAEGHPYFIVDGNLDEILVKANKQPNKGRRRIVYPLCVINAAIAKKTARTGIVWSCPRNEAVIIKSMDCGQQIFGTGLLMSERMTAERMTAERMAAERMAAERMAAELAEADTYELSPREKAVQKLLGKEGTGDCFILTVEQ